MRVCGARRFCADVLSRRVAGQSWGFPFGSGRALRAPNHGPRGVRHVPNDRLREPGKFRITGSASPACSERQALRARQVPNHRPRGRPKEAAMVRRWVPALALGGVWWWAVLRLVLEPAHAGPVEGAVAAGGWGLSLLPVHVTETIRPMGIFDAGTGLLRRCAEGAREMVRNWQSLISGSSIPGSSLPGSLPGSIFSPSWRGSGRFRRPCVLSGRSSAWYRRSSAWSRRASALSGRTKQPLRCAGRRSWSVGRAWHATRAWRRRRSGGGSGRS